MVSEELLALRKAWREAREIEMERFKQIEKEARQTMKKRNYSGITG